MTRSGSNALAEHYSRRGGRGARFRFSFCGLTERKLDDDTDRQSYPMRASFPPASARACVRFIVRAPRSSLVFARRPRSWLARFLLRRRVRRLLRPPSPLPSRPSRLAWLVGCGLVWLVRVFFWLCLVGALAAWFFGDLGMGTGGCAEIVDPASFEILRTGVRDELN